MFRLVQSRCNQGGRQIEMIGSHGVLGDMSGSVAFVPAASCEGLARPGVCVSSRGRRSVGKRADGPELELDDVLTRFFIAWSTQSSDAERTRTQVNTRHDALKYATHPIAYLYLHVTILLQLMSGQTHQASVFRFCRSSAM